VLEKGHVDYRVGDNKELVEVKQGQVYYIPGGHDTACMQDAVMVEFAVAGEKPPARPPQIIGTSIPGIL